MQLLLRFSNILKLQILIQIICFHVPAMQTFIEKTRHAKFLKANMSFDMMFVLRHSRNEKLNLFTYKLPSLSCVLSQTSLEVLFKDID